MLGHKRLSRQQFLAVAGAGIGRVALGCASSTLTGGQKPILATPVSEGYFAGALDFSKLPVNKDTLIMRLPVLFGAWKTGDHRDWNAIRTWVAGLRPLLQA